MSGHIKHDFIKFTNRQVRCHTHSNRCNIFRGKRHDRRHTATVHIIGRHRDRNRTKNSRIDRRSASDHSCERVKACPSWQSRFTKHQNVSISIAEQCTSIERESIALRNWNMCRATGDRNCIHRSNCKVGSHCAGNTIRGR